jgi:hypothetical protein
MFFLIFSTNVPETILNIQIIERYIIKIYIKNVHVTYPLFFQILMKIYFS